LIFNAFFASDTIIGLDGVNTGLSGGFLNGNYALLYIQIAYIVACMAYSFVVSAILAKIIDMIPGLKLRASEEAELLGMDDDQHGEFSYDYVEVRRDFLAWTPAQQDQVTDLNKFPPQHGIEEHQNMMPKSGNSTTTEPAELIAEATDVSPKEKST
jgi:ammonium transporter, Amt family